MPVLPTGAGKSVIISSVVAAETQPVMVIAHRKELVTQLSKTLAAGGVYHDIIAANGVAREACDIHRDEFGKVFYRKGSRVHVASVDTLVRRDDPALEQSIGLWVVDEGHHLLRENKWGRAVSKFINARGMPVTATPLRADGKGLGRHADGLTDRLILGPHMADLRSMGFLSSYRIMAPNTGFDRSKLKTSDATGDFTADSASELVRESIRVGCPVEHYQNICPGSLAVVFTTDVKRGFELEKAFKEAGISAVMLCANSAGVYRREMVRRFAKREIRVLINVDLFGEGFDIPALETVIMERPTESYAVYAQQFGRALRPSPGKPYGLILDLVGNTLDPRLGLPDYGKPWTLDRSDRKARSTPAPDAIPLRPCPSCTMVYERVYKACPYCGAVPEVKERSQPEQVDGDLTELDPEVMQALLAKAAALVGSPVVPFGGDARTQFFAAKAHEKRADAQHRLREAIAQWAGWQRHLGREDAEAYRRFFFRFGTDVLTAQTLGRPDAEALAEQIEKENAGYESQA